jgi:bifunctional ADP-heptose synthase (sugar kinase/adenylyltransferase)
MQLEFIDIITVFDEKDANPILDKLNFNVLFKGGDYNIEDLKKKFPNIEIMVSKLEENISTTIIEKKYI